MHLGQQEVRLTIGLIAVLGLLACQARARTPKRVARSEAGETRACESCAANRRVCRRSGRKPGCDRALQRRSARGAGALERNPQSQLDRRRRVAAFAEGSPLRSPRGYRGTGARTSESAARESARESRRGGLRKRARAADRCEQELVPYAHDRQANVIRARCRVVAGTAQTGLDERERAIENFRQALVLDPKVELATDATSPRVRELMALARSSDTP